jgi:endonuclease/exonuclease/phosphatase family metal-dependent hydrolase
MWLKRLSVISIFVVLFISGQVSAQDYGVPQRTEDNIVVASYNIKWFGELSHDLTKLAIVIENFDVCGIIEVKGESTVAELALALKTRTGKDWGYVYGFRTNRPDSTYHEAYGVVYRRDRVQLGDGVISNIMDLEETYRHDPYAVSFKRKNFDFILLLVHTRWTNDDYGTRANEVRMLASHINKFRTFLTERDFILAGDFNYSGTNQALKDMAQGAGLKQVDPNAKSTFKEDNSGYSSSYDHIYISQTDTGEFVSGQCKILDSTALVYGDNSTENMAKSKAELSDHLPVWAVFDVNQPDDD